MLIESAYVSGSLGQALFRDQSSAAVMILDGPEAAAREASSNEIYWFRYYARELALADPTGLPVSLEPLRSRLDEEVRFFRALDGLLVGMDADFSGDLRRRSIQQAEEILESDAATLERAIMHLTNTATPSENPPVAPKEAAGAPAGEIEVTDDMCDAAREAVDPYYCSDGSYSLTNRCWAEIFRAMIASQPIRDPSRS